MDMLDQRILLALSKNSNKSLKELSNALHCSKERIWHRIKNLEANKIILNYIVQINYGLLGQEYITVYAKSKNKDFSQRKEIQYFAKTISPDFDIVFDVCRRDNYENIVRDDNIIEIYETMDPEMAEYYITKPLGDIKTNLTIYNKSENEITLNATERKVLENINIHDKMRKQELANKVGLTVPTVSKIIKKFEQKKIISGYSIFIDYKKLGYELYNFQLKLNVTKEFISFARNNPNIFYLYKNNPKRKWNLDLGIIAKDPLDIRRLIINITKEWNATIHNYYIAT